MILMVFAENTIVPFEDKFPTDSYLYKLLSTKFGEGQDSDREIQEFVERMMKEHHLTDKKSEKQIEEEVNEKYGLERLSS